MGSRMQVLAIKTPADFTTRTEMGTIEIAKGGILTAVEVKPVQYTLTSTQTIGGIVELQNDAVDWKPFEFPTPAVDVLTSTSTGGEHVEPFRFEVHKKLPDNSTVTVFYTAKDAGNQSLSVTLYWETDMPYRGKQTLSQVDVGTEITQVTKDSEHNDLKIPSQKGGHIVGFLVKVHGTLETVVESGGKVEVYNKSATEWGIQEFMTGGASCIGAGAVLHPVQVVLANIELPAHSHVLTDYTPYDNQSQALTFCVVWER